MFLHICLGFLDGSVVYQDSPLLKALVEGHVAVIDEADKAPVQVVRMLHSLLARGEMQILDGRRIVSKPKELAGPQEIAMHPNFQVKSNLGLLCIEL